MNACRSLGRSFCILHFNLFTCLGPCFGTESVIAGALTAVKMQRALVACALVAREIDRRPESMMMMATAFFSHPRKLQQLQLSLSCCLGCAVCRESEIMRERKRERDCSSESASFVYTDSVLPASAAAATLLRAAAGPTFQRAPRTCSPECVPESANCVLVSVCVCVCESNCACVRVLSAKCQRVLWHFFAML